MLKRYKTIVSLIVVLLVSGVVFSQNTTQPSIQITPNPAVNFFKVVVDESVDAAEITVAIFDIIGTPLREYDTQVLNDNEVLVNIQSFKSGMYIVKVKGEDFLRTERLIVDKN